MNRAWNRVHKADVAVLSLSVLLAAFALAAVGPVGRERAQRTVCLAHVKQLTSAWLLYADQNDGKIVNGASGINRFSGNLREDPWVGQAWSSNWNSDNVANTGLTEQQKMQAIHVGALWPLVREERLYKCPVSKPHEWVTYAIVDAMNGLHRDGTYVSRANYVADTGVRVGMTVLWIKKKNEIISPPPARRMVFIDEGAALPDSFAVLYQGNGTWWDDPPARHNDGTTVSWADGHASDYRWLAPETIEFGRRARERYYGGFRPTTPEGQQDLDNLRRAVWGRISSDPQ
jgi:prepilin-type processing-associated H-X9-DG protein